MIDELQKLGFSRHEAKIYLALLETGQTTSGPIIKKTGLHRMNVYEALDRLLKKGLISCVIKAGKKHFKVVNPEKILDLIEEKRSLAYEIIPKLKVKQKEAEIKQEARIYEGQEGFATIMKEYVGSLRKGGTLYVIGAAGKAFLEAVGDFYPKFVKMREEKKIRIKLVAYQSQTKDLEYKRKEKFVEVRILPEEHEAPAATVISGDKIIIQVFSKPPLAILIKNKNVAKSYLNYFNILWKISKPFLKT